MPEASPKSGLSLTELMPFISNSILTNTEANVSIPQGTRGEKSGRG